MGQLVFLVSGQTKRTVALVTRDEIPLGGWFKRSWQSLVSLHVIDWKWLSAALGGIAIVAILLILLSTRRSRQKFSR